METARRPEPATRLDPAGGPPPRPEPSEPQSLPELPLSRAPGAGSRPEAPGLALVAGREPLSLLESLLGQGPDAGSAPEARTLALVAEREPLDLQDLLLALRYLGRRARPTIESLEDQGMIVRRRNPHDRRRIEVLLTPAGRGRLAALTAPAAGTQALSPAELAFLKDILDQIASARIDAPAPEKGRGARQAARFRRGDRP